MASEEFRDSTFYTVWFLDHAVDFRIRLYQFNSGERVPFDATTQGSWELQFYNTPGASSLRQSFPLTIDAADKEDGVENLLETSVRLLSGTDDTLGLVYCKVVAINGGVPSIYEAPWESQVVLAGPT
jgi:hypothetical protein